MNVFELKMLLDCVMVHGTIYHDFLSGSEPHILAQISLVGLATYLQVVILLLIAESIHIISTVSLKYGVFESLNRYDYRIAFRCCCSAQ